MLKKLYIFSVLFLLGSSIAFAQCDNDVSTDPENPTNNALPKDLEHLDGDERYLNGFNWFPLTGGGGLEDYDLTNMFWSGIPLPEMDNIWSNSIPHYNYINNSPRPLPKNGWELLLVNIGRFPNNVDIADSNETFQALPYIVLYNKYSGVIRLFANFGLDDDASSGADAIEVVMSFVLNDDNSGATGLGRLYSGKDLPLDKESKVTVMKSLAKATNAQRQWFSADFQIAYDPCTCYYPSKIQIHFNEIRTENIELHGRAISVEADGDNLINDALQIDPMSFLSGFDYTGNDEEKGGILIYKGLQKLVEDYESRYEKYKTDLAAAGKQNEIVEHNLGALKTLKYALTAIITYGIGGTAIDTGPIEATEWFTKMKEKYGSFIKKSGKLDIDNLLKIAKKVLGSDAKTYIEQNFEKVPLPSEPDASRLPSVTFTEMNFQGLISATIEKAGPTFYTPGTYGTEATKVLNLDTPEPLDKRDPILETMYEYPVYNEVLGTFALLNSPKMTITRRYAPDTAFEDDFFIVNSGGALQDVSYKSWTTEYQLKVNNTLAYSLNKAVDIEDYTIRAAIRFKAKTDYIDVNGQEFNTFIDPHYTTNLHANPYNKNHRIGEYADIDVFVNKTIAYDVNTYDPWRSYTGTPYTNTVEDGWGATTSFTTHPYTDEDGGAASTDVHYFENFDGSFQTPFMPLDALGAFKAGIGLKQEFFSTEGEYLSETTQGVGLEFYDIELILIVDIKYETFNDKGQQNTSTQILTYDINNPDLPVENYTYEYIDPTLHTGLDIGVTPENVGLDDIVFDGSPVERFSLIDNVYTCRAWNDIYINGNLTVVGDYIVHIVAGNEIVTNPESVTSPEVIWRIESPFDTSNPMLLADTTFLTDFCNSKYKANRKDPSIVGRQANEEVGLLTLPEEEAVTDEIRLYPNPANTDVNVFIGKEKLNGKVAIQVYDMAGKSYELTTNQQSGMLYNINIESLASGIYFIKVYDESTLLKTLKLVKK
ncbi:MAG: T9SS type A sorting domain-containing protein [Kordia sp.]|uniref:T9SS type A sorting domain-containing protein n=1 Tax=Kordia sp. TaxID=1965332 RepID=UPI00385F6BDB